MDFLNHKPISRLVYLFHLYMDLIQVLSIHLLCLHLFLIFYQENYLAFVRCFVDHQMTLRHQILNTKNYLLGQIQDVLRYDCHKVVQNEIIYFLKYNLFFVLRYHRNSEQQLKNYFYLHKIRKIVHF